MHLYLLRSELTADGTFGVLSIAGTKLYTCEEDWKNNAPSISCIPAGIYRIQRGAFPKHGETFQVMDVPQRSSILIHAGNTEEDTMGCILLGMRRGILTVPDEDDPQHPQKSKMAVVESRTAFAKFMAMMAGINTATLEVAWRVGLP